MAPQLLGLPHLIILKAKKPKKFQFFYFSFLNFFPVPICSHVKWGKNNWKSTKKAEIELEDYFDTVRTFIHIHHCYHRNSWEIENWYWIVWHCSTSTWHRNHIVGLYTSRNINIFSHKSIFRFHKPDKHDIDIVIYVIFYPNLFSVYYTILNFSFTDFISNCKI